MKNKIFGRKVGSHSPMPLLLEGLAVSSGGKMTSAYDSDHYHRTAYFVELRLGT